MLWNIGFITEENFKDHIRNTIDNYGEKLNPYNVVKFNDNIIDPIKMIFDKSVYNISWKEIISNEIFRQRDKSNTNEIGYFHQKLFQYVDKCHVPTNGQEGGWDVIFDIPEGYSIDGANTVHKIFVEMKNKHNTMNSAASAKTYIKMQQQLLQHDDCACFLVEVIAKQSQNIVWQTTVDGKKVKHNRIRRVSLDKFYEIVTGDSGAFLKICCALPTAVNEVISEYGTGISIPHDTVYDEIKSKADLSANLSEDDAMTVSMYMLGFGTYNGFSNIAVNR